MTYNDALRLAAAMVKHTRRGDDQLVRVLHTEIATRDDAIRVNNALLVLVRWMLRDTSVEHVDRVMDQAISKITDDDAGGGAA